jgi:hypothetical protein
MAMLQLSEQEAEAYRNCPIILDMGSGFYIFPVSAPSELITVMFPEAPISITDFKLA